MIKDYKLKCEDNEDILYVYLDFNYEFSLENFKSFGKNLRQYLNSIIFFYKANKIKIVINGIIIATLFVVPTTIKDNPNIENNIIYVESNTIKNNDEILLDNIEITKSTEIIDTKNNSNEDIISSSNTKTNNTIKEGNNATEKVEINNAIKESEVVSKNEVTTNETTISEVVDNNTYVTIYRENGSVITVELEKYLIGVVAAEMPASFNTEALKAQAVVARTYTLKRISEGKALTDTTSTQVYKNNNELKNMWGNDYLKYYNKIADAVNITKGKYITYNGNYIDAVYHSTSNGYTEDAVFVWGNSIPYLKSVESSYDKDASSYMREVNLTYSIVSSKLGIAVDENTAITITKNASNRVTEIKLNDTTFKGADFRNKLSLRSTDFNIELNDNDVLITTYGYGHGVGMSQYGANGMANAGYNYMQILKYYYTGVTIN